MQNTNSSHLTERAGEAATAAAHTPAPWSFREWMHTKEDLAEVRRLEASGLAIHPIAAVMNSGERIVMAESGRVALVDCQTPFKRGQGSTTECAVRDANARLIAAAPDLLAALKLAFRELNGGHDRLSGLEHAEAHRLARAAINRATGAA